MDENWYAAEQQVRDRLTEARAAARIRTLTRGLQPKARRPHFIGAAVIRLVSWVWARAIELSPAHSRDVANVRAATKRG
jgi:hypothetical protein